MRKFVTAAYVALAFVGSAMAEGFTPEPVIPVGPTRVDGRILDYQGLLTGFRPAEVRQWLDQQYPSAPFEERTISLRMESGGAVAEMAPFVNFIKNKTFVPVENGRVTRASMIFNSWSGGNQLIGYEFATEYDKEVLPKYDAIYDSLIEKYGDPTNLTDENRSVVLNWAYKDGLPANCDPCAPPLGAGFPEPYGPAWFQRADRYVPENYDFSLEVRLWRENSDPNATRIETVTVRAMDAEKARSGMNADNKAMSDELERVRAELEQKPSTGVRF